MKTGTQPKLIHKPYPKPDLFVRSEEQIAEYQPSGAITMSRAQYTEAIKRNKSKTSKLESDIEHRALVNLGENVQKLSVELQPIEKTLKGFQDLPPDSTMARIKLEQSKLELDSLRQELTTLTEGEAGRLSLVRGY